MGELIKMHNFSDSVNVNVAILTISDTRIEENDRSGQQIRESLLLKNHSIVDYKMSKDDLQSIQEIVKKWSVDPDIQAIILNGGTGFSPRDVTYEAVSSLLNKKMDGFGELFRSLSYEEIGPKAMFSRSIAGSIDSTAIYALPGSTNAVKLAMEKLILPTMPHFVEELVKK